MAKVFFKTDNVTHEVDDGTPLIDFCDESDISLSFGCTEGTCGVCEVTVVEGRKNLSRITDEEKDYLLEYQFSLRIPQSYLGLTRMHSQ